MPPRSAGGSDELQAAGASNASRRATVAGRTTRRVRLGAMELIAHGGHAIYDHPAMMAISLAALVIPLIVLGFVAKIFVRSAKNDRD
jgi:hypothetical protein